MAGLCRAPASSVWQREYLSLHLPSQLPPRSLLFFGLMLQYIVQICINLHLGLSHIWQPPSFLGKRNDYQYHAFHRTFCNNMGKYFLSPALDHHWQQAGLPMCQMHKSHEICCTRAESHTSAASDYSSGSEITSQIWVSHTDASPSTL